VSRTKKILKHYEPRIDSDLANFEILDWASGASQTARFAALADNVPLSGKSLLDVGCGLGDLWAFLKQRSLEVDYTGVDISEKMLSAARKRHENIRFVCADLFADCGQDSIPFGPGTFDVVFSSGTFNLNLGNNISFLPAAIDRLREFSHQYIVFNLLHIRTPQQSSRYAYYDPAVVMEQITLDQWSTQLLEDYLQNDFTVICRRQCPR